MFGWFRPSSDCPIEAEDRAALDRQWERLVGLFGRERVRRAEVILPLARFFPDPYDTSEKSVERLLHRLCGYMDVPRDRVVLELCDTSLPRPERIPSNGCDPGTVRPPVAVEVDLHSVDDPLAVVGTMARDLAMLHLLDAGRVSAEDEDRHELAELLAVLLGLGVIAANSNVREVQWSDLTASYLRSSRRGGLSLREYGYALALFARDRDDDGATWFRILRPDVKEAFRQTQRCFAAEANRNRYGGDAGAS